MPREWDYLSPSTFIDERENGGVIKEMQERSYQFYPKERRGRLPFWKRLLDLSLLCLLSIGALIIGGIVAITIKLGSRGPVLFRQQRVGYKGEEFICYKFRTMRVGAETKSHRELTQRLIESDEPMHKLDIRQDPRLIPFARMLRAGGLDELPQLYNVLRGEMSIVGPRPCIPYECEAYKSWHWHRFDSVPGLTGLWQVSGKNRTTFDEMVRLDIAYTQSMSLWLDLKIIARTPLALVNQFLDLKVAKRGSGKGRDANNGQSREGRDREDLHLQRRATTPAR